MRVGVQWTLADPQDWQWIDHKDWHKQSRKPVPHASSVIDNNPGWVFALNCQGIVMRGFDHYAIEQITDAKFGEGLRFTLWQDDLDDFAIGERWATVWELFEPAPDPVFGGAINTRQRRFVFSEPASGHPGITHDWAQFKPPHTSVTAHGTWVTDDLFAQHHAIASQHGWREWVR